MAVVLNVVSNTSNGESKNSSISDAIGISGVLKVDVPISTLNNAGSSFSNVISIVLIPDFVSTVIFSCFKIPFLYTKSPKHLIPLPHISASLPSGLNILYPISATSEGVTNNTPSPPTPKCLWHKNLHASALSASGITSPALSSIIGKSLPIPCILENFNPFKSIFSPIASNQELSVC